MTKRKIRNHLRMVEIKKKAKIYAAIKALQKLKIENILHLPSKAKRKYDPTESEIFVDISGENSIIPQNIPPNYQQS